MPVVTYLLTYLNNDLNLLAVELRMGAFPEPHCLFMTKTVAQCELEPEECQKQKPHRTKEIICLPGNFGNDVRLLDWKGFPADP